MSDNTKREELAKSISFGAGAAIGVVLRLALHLGVLWVGLWILAKFGWLPF